MNICDKMHMVCFPTRPKLMANHRCAKTNGLQPKRLDRFLAWKEDTMLQVQDNVQKQAMPLNLQKRLLIIDDDVMLAESLSEQFDLHGEFSTHLAHTAEEGLHWLSQASADLVLMDVGLPDMDGREACRNLRAKGLKCPIIMLTGADSEADTILGLESGANDYVTKPFRYGVLLARVRAHLRQHEQSEDAVFNIGPYKFKPTAKLLVHEKTAGKIRLTEKETAILKFLYRAGARVTGRDVLLHEVWGYNSAVTTHTLETHIYRLRQKIEENPSHARLLITDQGGYKLCP